MNTTILSSSIKLMRQASGLNQEGVAQILGIDQAGISRIENSQQPPTAEQIITLTNHYGVEVSKFFEGKVNLWDIAIKFDNAKWIPKKYTQFRTLRIRELSPFLNLVAEKAGKDALDSILKKKKMHHLLNMEQEEIVSVYCLTDLFKLAESGEIQNFSLDDFSEASNFAIEQQLFMQEYFNSSDVPLTLLHKFIAMSGHFSGLFSFELIEQTPTKCVIEWGLKPENEEFRLKIGRYRQIFKHFYLNILENIPRVNGYKPFKAYVLDDFKGSFGSRQKVRITPA